MSGTQSGWDRVQLLTEPTRRRVYDAVRTAREPLTRDDVAAAAGVSRRLAAFHLDVLAEHGLLDVDFARPPGRSGPGAGRPSKRYRAAPVDVDVSVPPRRYDLAARLLARAVAAQDGRAAADTAVDLARQEGRDLGALRRSAGRVPQRRSLGVATAALRDLGYEPAVDESGRCVRLRNCPFHAVVEVAPALVCGMNEALVSGLLDGLGTTGVVASLHPSPPDCCVRVDRE